MTREVRGTNTAWRRVAAGVDSSFEGVWAAEAAWQIAAVYGAECRLVHAAVDPSANLMTIPPGVDVQSYVRGATAAARAEVERALRDRLPDAAMTQWHVRPGKPSWVLPRIVREFDVDLLVLGGKHHRRLRRWFVGSTAHNVVRSVDVPVLVTIPTSRDLARILVAVDLSEAGAAVIGLAGELSSWFGAELRVIHVVEPMPFYAKYPFPLPQADYVEWAGGELDRQVRAVLGDGVDTAVKKGPAVKAIAAETSRWGADVLVTGTHGKGWVDRLLLGSTTTQLLDHLPTSLLVVPVPPPQVATTPLPVGDRMLPATPA